MDPSLTVSFLMIVKYWKDVIMSLNFDPNIIFYKSPVGLKKEADSKRHAENE